MPRLRADQLMEFAWKFMLPMSVVNLIAAGIWIALDGGARCVDREWIVKLRSLLRMESSLEPGIQIQTTHLPICRGSGGERMNLLFIITALITMVSAIAAMALRNLVHCVLCLAVTFAGIALVFLQIGAEFIGFAQVLVYIGAVSILVLFALLMTRGGTELTLRQWNPGHWITGTIIGVAVFSMMSFGILKSTLRQAPLPKPKRIP
jgi:NADH:ubiquinone oxidoreductase subunit 6 (subunit J)